MGTLAERAGETRAAARSAVSLGPLAEGGTVREVGRHAVAIPERRAEAAATQALAGLTVARGDGGPHRAAAQDRSGTRPGARRASGRRVGRGRQLRLGRLHAFLELLHLADETADLTEGARFGKRGRSRGRAVVGLGQAGAGGHRRRGPAVAVRHGGRTGMGRIPLGAGPVEGAGAERFRPRGLLAGEAGDGVDGLAHAARLRHGWGGGCRRDRGQRRFHGGCMEQGRGDGRGGRRPIEDLRGLGGRRRAVQGSRFPASTTTVPFGIPQPLLDNVGLDPDLGEFVAKTLVFNAQGFALFVAILDLLLQQNPPLDGDVVFGLQILQG